MKLLYSFILLFSIAYSVFAQDHGWAVEQNISVPDVQVVTQNGERLRFNSELVKGRIAIVTGFFTSCTAMCPITKESLANVAKILGPRVGKDVIIVSLSVDPETDTPARMKAWAEKFHIGRGWTLASGNKADVQLLLNSLGLAVDLPQRHQSLLMIGSETTGWVRISSWTPAEKLAKLVDSLVASKAAASMNIATQKRAASVAPRYHVLMFGRSKPPEQVNNGRFEIEQDGHIAYLEYNLAGKVLQLIHSEVPEALRGRGLASELAKSALDWARENGVKVDVICPSVAAYIEKHPEYSSLVLP